MGLGVGARRGRSQIVVERRAPLSPACSLRGTSIPGPFPGAGQGRSPYRVFKDYCFLYYDISKRNLKSCRMFSSLRVGERPGEGFGAGGRQKERRARSVERKEVSVETRCFASSRKLSKRINIFVDSERYDLSRLLIFIQSRLQVRINVIYLHK